MGVEGLLTSAEVGEHLDARAGLEVPDAARNRMKPLARLLRRSAEIVRAQLAHLMTPSPPADASVPNG